MPSMTEIESFSRKEVSILDDNAAKNERTVSPTQPLPYEFSPDDVISLFRSRNYKVVGRVGSPQRGMEPKLMVIDTGCGPNLIAREALNESFHRYIRPCPPSAALRSANKSPLRVTGVILLTLQLGDLEARVHFGVVDGLAADIIIGTSFQDRFISGIFPIEQRVVPINSRPVPIRRRSFQPTETDCLTIESQTDDIEDRRSRRQQKLAERAHSLRLAKPTKLEPWTERYVLVHSPIAGTVAIGPHPNTMRHRAVLAANGVAEVKKNVPFLIRVGNFSSAPMYLHKGSYVGTVSHCTDEDLNDVLLLTPEAMDDITDLGRSAKNDNVHPREQSNPPRTDPPNPNPFTSNLDEPVKDWTEELQIGDEYQERRSEIIDTLSPFQSMWDGHLGHVKDVKHRITLTENARPYFQHPYRAGPDMREAERTEIQRMLQLDVIEPSNSPWAAPTVFAPKKDGSLRFCVDYRRLNDVTVRDSYPIPRMDECLDSLGDAKIFSTLDANTGYWQVEIDEQSRSMTTFSSHWGVYRFKRMPFGLRNAPATFQRALDVILSSVRWQSALVYLDDVIIFSRNFEDHVRDVQTTLSLLQKHGLSLKLRKSFFFQSSVDYLGHVVRPGKLQVASKTVDAVQKMHRPTNLTELRSFLGLCNVYRRFVPNFSRIASPLTAKLEKGKDATFPTLTEEEENAFLTLKKKLASPPELALPQSGRTYIVDTDACDKQVGCVLLQEDENDVLHPIGYWSRTLTKPEKNYDATHRECLAIVWAVLVLRPYLEGTHFKVRTDHHSLRWIMNLANASGRLARWRLRLQEFDFEVVHRAGSVHMAPDAMSRLPTDGADDSELNDDVPVLVISDTADRTEAASRPRTDVRRVSGPVGPEVTHSPTSDPTNPRQTRKTNDVPYRACELDLGRETIVQTCKVNDRTGAGYGTVQAYATTDGDPNNPGIYWIDDDLDMDHKGRQSDDSASPILVLEREGRFEPVAPEEFLAAQKDDAYCRDTAQTVGQPGSAFNFDRDGILVRRSTLDGSIQKVVPDSLRSTILSLAHDSPAAGHPGAIKMYETMRRFLYWPLMASDVYDYVRGCASCARVRGTAAQRQKLLTLFPAAGPLEFVAMDIAGPYPRTRNGNEYVVVLTDRFTKLTRAIPTRTTTASDVASIFIDYWIYSYGVPDYLLTDRGTQFMSKFFELVCSSLGVKHVATSAYRPQTNGQAERYNRTMVSRLRHYICEHQTDWDDYVQPLTYAYNLQVHRTTKFTPFELTLSRAPPNSIVSTTHSSAPPDAPRFTGKTLKEARIARTLRGLIERARTNMASAQGRYKRMADAKVRPISIPEKGNQVFVDRPPSSAKTVAERVADMPHSKLRPKTVGPYTVVSANRDTVTIDEDGVHNTVSIDRITPAPANKKNDVPVANANANTETEDTEQSAGIKSTTLNHEFLWFLCDLRVKGENSK